MSKGVYCICKDRASTNCLWVFSKDKLEWILGFEDPSLPLYRLEAELGIQDIILPSIHPTLYFLYSILLYPFFIKSYFTLPLLHPTQSFFVISFFILHSFHPPLSLIHSILLFLPSFYNTLSFIYYILLHHSFVISFYILHSFYPTLSFLH